MTTILENDRAFRIESNRAMTVSIHLIAVVLAFLTLILAPTEVEGVPAIQYKTSTRRTMNCDRFTKNIDECDTDKYHTLLLLQALPYILVAVSLLFFIPIYFVCKYVFDCCGGRRQSVNFCHPDKRSATVYNRMDLLRPRIFAVVAAVVCLAAAILGCLAMLVIQQCMRDVRSRVRNIVDMAVGYEKLHMSAMKVALYNSETDSEYPFLLSSLESNGPQLNTLFRSRVETVKGIYDRTVLSAVNAGRRAGFWMLGLFLAPTVLTLVGLPVAFCNYRRYVSMFLFLFIGVFGIIVWTTAGAFAALNFFITDSCFEVEEFAEGRSNILTALSECDETSLTRPTAIIESLFKSQAGKTCEILKPYCYNDGQDSTSSATSGSVFSCPKDMSCDNVTDLQMAAWVDSTIVIAQGIVNNSGALQEAKNKGHFCSSVRDGGMCDLRKCASDCKLGNSLSNVGRVAKSVLVGVTAVSRARAMHETVSSALGSCESVLTTLASAMLSPCKTATKSLFVVEECLGLLGLGCILAMFVYAIGAKRFISLKKAYVPQND
ncbi:hypothetical protein, conserved [Trypanosoma brucei gambiense DAL972]|uniref:Uncharacterized protein n=1 Tax=Trypanosoma brucei gambiense (strain MHOM/CI/86/DAL972) TaxID=679716 RepID=D0A3Z3_TRYB9|nr:hypothetical protein, conserved [Trypanosoma brucei gambiense DAL972]CBH15987.1 hypothetical protein, conserved [Trypanosoma brucei gambiense DAL972]|eukprot:XP_011778251.1 hypothetical protein, conserved [Trypanosoma brucei gambiense DAL972]